MQRMTELEENSLRTLFARYREQDPLEFIQMVMSTFLIRTEPGSIALFRHLDDDKIPDGGIVSVKGALQIAAVEKVLMDLKKRLEGTSGEGEE